MVTRTEGNLGYLLRIDLDTGAATVVGCVPDSWGAAISGGVLYRAG